MPKYEIKVVEPFAYSERNYATGDVLGSIETEMSPVMLLEFQRAGRASIVSPDAPADGVGVNVDKSAPAAEGGGEALESLDAAAPVVGDVGSTEATASDAPAALPGELPAETPGELAVGEVAVSDEAIEAIKAGEVSAATRGDSLAEPTVEELTTETQATEPPQGDLEPESAPAVEAPAAAPPAAGVTASRKKSK